MSDRVTLKRLARALWTELRPLSEAELRALLGECEGVTETNCSFVEYELAQAAVPQMVSERLRVIGLGKELGRYV